MENSEILIAFIEHGLWPLGVMTLLVVLVWRGELSKVLSSIQSLKFGSFSIATREGAKNFNVLNEYESLSDLTMPQLHLFLVVGGESGDAAIYQSPLPSGEFRSGFKKLSSLGLIEYKDGENVNYSNTEKGKKLHKVIMDNLYASLVLEN